MIIKYGERLGMPHIDHETDDNTNVSAVSGYFSLQIFIEMVNIYSTMYRYFISSKLITQNYLEYN